MDYAHPALLRGNRGSYLMKENVMEEGKVPEVFPLWRVNFFELIQVRMAQREEYRALAVAVIVPSMRSQLTLEVLADLERAGLLLIEIPQIFASVHNAIIVAHIVNLIEETRRLSWQHQCIANENSVEPNPEDYIPSDLPLTFEEERRLLEELNDPRGTIDPLW